MVPARRLPLLLLFVLCLSAPQSLSAQMVVRGPYLQNETPTSIVVRWRTDVATATCVFLGASVDTLATATLNLSPTTEHIVSLDGLQPDTRYFYAVGTDTAILAGPSMLHFFSTAPPPGTQKPTRLWVVGDSGLDTPGARAVRDAYTSHTATRPTDGWLFLGDNAYWNGLDTEYQAGLFDLYRDRLLNTCSWLTIGNHDGYNADSETQTGPYYDNFSPPTQGEAGGLASGTEAWYSFDYANIHFVCLDSYDSDRSTTGPMLSWLKDDLASNTVQWTVAFWHHPPYTRGSYDSDLPSETRIGQMRRNALPILEAAGVDLVLCGHSHAYERSYLLNGHYGMSATLTPEMILDGGDGNPDGDGAYRKPSASPTPNAGTVYVVCGVACILRTGPLNHPAMAASMSRFGSLVLDIDGPRLDCRFLGDAGQILDRFAIVKQDSPQAGWVLY